MTNELTPHLQPGASGLDFGSGPGPALSTLMREQGYTMTDYDPFYTPDSAALTKRYDFITATEVFEHLCDPTETLDQLHKLLRPGGILAVMTEMVTDPQRFPDWWYHTDPTHVCFYSQATMRWIAESYGWQITLPRNNVVLFTVG